MERRRRLEVGTAEPYHELAEGFVDEAAEEFVHEAVFEAVVEVEDDYTDDTEEADIEIESVEELYPPASSSSTYWLTFSSVPAASEMT